MKLFRTWLDRPFTAQDALTTVVLIVLIGTLLANGTLQNAGPLVIGLVVFGDIALLSLGLKYFGLIGKKVR